MGFPTAYRGLQLPSYVLQALYVLAFFRKLIATLCPYLGLPDFLAHEISHPDPTRLHRQAQPTSNSSSTSAAPNHRHHHKGACSAARLTDDFFPVVRFSDLQGVQPAEYTEDCCAVCLIEFEGDDEIRWLKNCGHLFHRSCVDRWIMGYRRMTCPLCRTKFVPDDMLEDFHQMVFGFGSGVYGLYGEISTADRSYSGFNFL